MSSIQTAFIGFISTALALIGLYVASEFVGQIRGSPGGFEPPVHFNPSSVDFGTILQSQTVRREFRALNHTDTSIRIAALLTSCSCAVPGAGIVGKSIPPGGSVSIPVEFDSGSSHGPTSATITLFYETGGSRYSTQATLRGEIEAEFEIEPETLDFGTVEPGEELTRTVLLRTQRNNSLKITGGSSSHRAFQVAWYNREETNSGRTVPTAEITFCAPDLRRRQSITGIVRLTTSSDRVPSAKLSVCGQVAPAIEAIPSVIVRVPNQNVTRNTRLTIRTAFPSRIVRISADGGAKELSTVDAAGSIGDDWRLTHVVLLPTNFINDIEHINIQLCVREGADRDEVRSVSVSLKDLCIEKEPEL